MKKPSPARLELSCTLTPSSVMLSAPCGRPLMVVPRLLLPVVCAPGSAVTKSSAVRVVSGSDSICLHVDDAGDRGALGLHDRAGAFDDDRLVDAADFELDRNRCGRPGDDLHVRQGGRLESL